MSARHAVWIGAAGTVTGHGVACRIRAAWSEEVRIIAADINPPSLVAAAELADSAEQIPPIADRAAFVAALRTGLARHEADTYVPLLVDEIAVAAELVQEGALSHVRVLAPSPETARLCTDKLALMRALEAAGVRVPPTEPAGEAVWWPEGVIVKDRGGEGSRGVERIDDPAGLSRAHERGDGAVAQRRCRPPEVTVDAFRARRDGTWAAVCRERLEVRAGVCTKARLHRDDALEGLVRKVAEVLDLRGALCVQGMRGRDGWEITDVNPRCGGATAMSAAAGTDVIAAALADLWEEDPAPFLVPFAGEAHVVRSYSESVRPLPRVIAFDLDGTLLDCRARQVAVAEHVAAGLDAARFWDDKQQGASTAAALALQGRESADAAAAWVEQVERSDWLALDRPLPGAAEALEEVRVHGYRPVVLTARRDADAVRDQVVALGLVPASDVLVVDPAAADREKARALRDLDAIGFVGDNESDGRAAAGAGVPFACVDTGQRSAAFLREQGIEPVPGGVAPAARRLLEAAAAGMRSG